jgi:MFS family permease
VSLRRKDTPGSGVVKSLRGRERDALENRMSAQLSSSAIVMQSPPARWGAFSYPAFTVIWVASIFLNIGNAMFDTASIWLMTSLRADPVAVSLVQVAAGLPFVLLTLPAGALADITDSRRFLIIAELAVLAVVTIFAILVSLGRATPIILLFATFFLSAGISLSAPAWHSVVPLFVDRSELRRAITANSIGYNLSRAVGPALAGLAITWFGVAAPFWIDWVACLIGIAALIWWRSPRATEVRLPAERLTAAVTSGLLHTVSNQRLRAPLMRVMAFFLFASASWTLLPLVARSQMEQGPACYGVLLGAIGVGAFGGSLGLGFAKDKLGPDGVFVLGTLGTVSALILYGLAHSPVTAVCASVIAGASSSMVLTSLHSSAYSALPDRVRGRGLAIFLTAVFGSMTIGSAVWGYVAGAEGLPLAYFAAAAGAVLLIPLTMRRQRRSPADVSGFSNLGRDQLLTRLCCKDDRRRWEELRCSMPPTEMEAARSRSSTAHSQT